MKKIASYTLMIQRTLIIDVSESSFSISYHSWILSLFWYTDLRFNCEKTEAFWILLYKNWETTISSSKPIIWGKRYGFSTSNDTHI